ncbi:MAG: twin-arginine translocation signal domain-containing protein [Prosthecobacter sp.]|nr:twin-arginine translocation signal domain-containing protein [Prosthecobacter sp.]
MPSRRRFLQTLASGGIGLATTQGFCAPASAAEAPTVGILFFGNSHTYTQQVPMLFDKLCLSSGQFKPAIRSVTNGGVSLTELLDDPRVLKTVTDPHQWDVIVLQEQSAHAAAAATFKEPADAYADAIRRFTSLFRERNPNLLVVLYQTWPRNFAKWPEDAPNQALFGKSQADMHQRMRLANARAAQALSDHLKGTNVRVLVSPVGDFWMQVLRQHPEIPMYDGENHASPAGAWLAAYVLLGTILGRTTLEKADWSGTADKATITKLRLLVLAHPEIFHQAGKVE